MKDNHIVLTTVNVPHVLHDLCENVRRYNRSDEVVCWVVGDRKTPEACAALCKDITSRGLETYYLDIAYQDGWGRRFPEFYRSIPYDNESRRNIGYLHALEHGCRRLISIDDDNFPGVDDFVGFHAGVSTVWDGPIVRDETGFHNVCEYLEFIPQRKVYPRGFPFEMRSRHKNTPVYMDSEQEVIGLNQGLWLCAPDVDATTWLNGPVESVRYVGNALNVVDHQTWLPINTQNTCVMRELIPAYFCVPMAFDVPGGKIERYGDIWGGYFFQALIKDTPYRIAFGKPIAEHRRNPHNYLEDLRHEFWGMVLTDWLLDLLKNQFVPCSPDIYDRLPELAEFLDESLDSLPSWCPEEIHRFIKVTAARIRLWGQVCRDLS